MRQDASGYTRKAPRPIDAERLQMLAIAYAGRYATTRAKLAAYLQRKLKQAGWAGDGAAPVEALVERFAELGYVDDRAFAEARSGALLRRGYGGRRVQAALQAAGVSEEDGAEARDVSEDQALAAAMAFARRKRIGPFASEAPDRQGRERWIAALIRAGHDFALARRIAHAEPGHVSDMK